MPSKSCPQCNEQFESYDLWRRHHWTVHVQEVVVALGDFNVAVRKNERGNFKCDNCGSEAIDCGLSVESHVSRCYGKSSLSTEILSVQPAVNEISVVTRIYCLKFYEEYRLIRCLRCDSALGRGVANHVQKYGFNIIKSHLEMIEAALQPESLYLAKVINEPLEPICFLPVLNGFKCSICVHYSGCEKTAKEHLRSKHRMLTREAEGKYSSCLVQTLATKSSVKVYFPVTRRVLSAPIMSLAPTVVDQMIDDEIKEALRPEAMESSWRDRGIFYDRTNWWSNVQNLTIEQVSSITSSVKPPTEQSEKEKFEGMVKLFTLLIAAVKKSPHHHRARVGEFVGAKLDAFSSIIDQRNEYARTFARLMFFLRRAIDGEMVEGEAWVAAFREFWENPSMETADSAFFKIVEYFPGKTEISILLMFIEYSCLREDRSLMKASEVQRICARLIYFCKLACIGLLRQENDEQAAGFRIYRLLEEDRLNVFHRICGYKALATSAAKSETQIPSIIGSDVPFVAKMTTGVTVTMADLCKAYRVALVNCKELVESLTFGLDLDLHCEDCVESYRNGTIGFSILNTFPETDFTSKILLKHMCSDPVLRKKYFLNPDSPDLNSFKPEAVDEYLRSYGQLGENEIVVAHVGGGMPSRSTELETIKIFNGASARRNVFILDRNIFLLTEYSKCRHIKSSERGIARFLDEESSSLLLKDILVVRPLVILMAQKRLSGIHNFYKSHLFVKLGQVLCGRQIRDCFKQRFNLITGKAVSFGDYRHVVKKFSRDLSIQFEMQVDDFDEDDDDVNGDDGDNRGSSRGSFENDTSDQFGHSIATSRSVYGRKSTEIQEMPQSELFKYRDVSFKWHRSLRGETANPPLRPRSEPDPLILNEKGAYEDAAARVNVFRADAEATIATYPRSTNQAVIGHVVVSQSLNLLKRMFKDEGARFISIEQKRAIEYALFSDANLLVILRTGGGKSLLMMMVAFKEINKSCLVILPTVSLVTDMKRKFEKHGFTCATRAEGFNQHQFLLLTPEAVETEGAKRLLLTLSSSGLISRIVIDEVHMFSIDGKFRKSFRSLSSLRMLNVPLVLMTATAAAWVVADVVDNLLLGAKDMLMVRGASNRPNIVYSFYEGLGRDAVISELRRWYGRLELEDRTIIYFASIEELKAFSECCRKVGIIASVYFASMTDADKESCYSKWLSGERLLMLATSAFGVGIDWPHVRLVINYQLPFSVEEFAQQTGRAGRDGKKATALTFFDKRSAFRFAETLQDPIAKEGFLRMIHFACISGSCLRRFLSRYFDGAEVDCIESESELCDGCQENPEATTNQVVNRLPVPVTPLITATARMSILSEEERRRFATLLKFYLGKFTCSIEPDNPVSTSNHCVICAVAGNNASFHRVSDCSRIRGKCLRCLEFGHQALFCKTIRYETKGVYRCCLLPEFMDGESFHSSGSKLEECLFADILKFFGAGMIKFEGMDPSVLTGGDYFELYHRFVDFCEKQSYL